MINDGDVSAVLAAWLPHQRWYGGKSREASIIAKSVATVATEPGLVQIWFAEATYAEGSERYQVPLVFYPEPRAALDHAHVGSVLDSDSQRPVEIYDALHDRDSTPRWLQRVLADDDESSALRFSLDAEPNDIPVTETSLVMTAEQSNTSIVFGDAAIMKFFRRVEPGLNPDIEVHKQLSKLGGRHVARLLAHVWLEVDGQSTSLAMLQEFMRTATDGWQVATSSVRDLMAEGDLHADEAGADFAAEAARLGTATAEVHADLATAFSTAELQPEDLSVRATAMNARLDAALSEVPELAEVELGLRKAYAEFAAFEGPVLAQRIHGDLHLGQVLRTVHRWVMLDFEGEPAKSIGERQSLDSPLRDIASMLRSFDYAARYQLVDIGATPQSEFRAIEWAERNRAAFCRGYVEAGGANLDDAAVLIRAYEADKAVYEAVYEARNRPHWLPIPLASLHRLAAPGADN